ncbi:Proteins containing SET domain protein [Minicystis rosea]|nr:Proteins containing SET domain protein [Minicystis rosea]
MTSKRSKEPMIEVKPSAIAGLGVFARSRIPRGTRIIEYTGELITEDEAGRRYDDDAMEKHHTFLFAVDDDLLIDGGVDGNDARYFNHACAPNCEAVIEDGRVFIEAITDVAAGTELLYDYALVRDDDWQDRWAELYACRCGVPRCRGTILKSPKPPRKAAKKTSGRKAMSAKRSDKAPGSGRTTKAGKRSDKAPVSGRSTKASKRSDKAPVSGRSTKASKRSDKAPVSGRRGQGAGARRGATG